MLTRENTEILIEFLCRDNRFAYTKDDFISDEENIDTQMSTGDVSELGHQLT